MSDFKFKLNSQGVKELLKSDAITQELERIARQQTDAKKIDVYVGKNRVNVSVQK